MPDYPITSAISPESRKEIPVVALVCPCYNEEEVLPVSVPKLLSLLDNLVVQGLAKEDSFIFCVDDGSIDQTWRILKEYHSQEPRLKAISLAHNKGQQNALYAALTTIRSRCDAVVTIDIDLQDSLDAVFKMLSLYKQGYDIVYGVRNCRAKDTWFKRNSAMAFYSFQKMLGLEVVYNHSEFRLMSRRVLDSLAEYGETHLFIRGLMCNMGYPSAVVEYERSQRIAGETKYSFSKLLSLSIDGITSFTARPMRLILGIGAAILLFDIIVAIWVLISHFYGNAISGWSSLMISVWFLASLILISLGIIGEYIGKIFDEVKSRPRFIISDTLLD